MERVGVRWGAAGAGEKQLEQVRSSLSRWEAARAGGKQLEQVGSS